MVQRIIVELVDDTNGKKADETVRFSLDGTEYEIDLTQGNATQLRRGIDLYVSAGRRMSGRNNRKVPRGRAAEVDTRAVRAWAASNGLAVAARGRIPAAVIGEYQAAGN